MIIPFYGCFDKKRANSTLIELALISFRCIFLLLQTVHLSFLLLDSLIIDVLIVRHQLIDGS